MAQFSVHRNNHARTRGDIPYLLDLQADILSILATRLVVPLYRMECLGSRPMARLTPVVRFQGQELVAMVPELAGIPSKELGPALGDLAADRNELIQALDLLVTGF
jgi:toxin CcdB